MAADPQGGQVQLLAGQPQGGEHIPGVRVVVTSEADLIEHLVECIYLLLLNPFYNQYSWCFKRGGYASVLKEGCAGK